MIFAFYLTFHRFPVANNSRILSIEDRALYLQPNSRTQVLVPVKAIASGKVELQAQLETLRGTKYQGISTLAVTIAVIGPIVGWVMAIAGILLIGAAGTRIFRRVRKARLRHYGSRSAQPYHWCQFIPTIV